MNDRGTVTIDSRTGRTLTYLGFVVRAERQRRRSRLVSSPSSVMEIKAASHTVSTRAAQQGR